MYSVRACVLMLMSLVFSLSYAYALVRTGLKLFRLQTVFHIISLDRMGKPLSWGAMSKWLTRFLVNIKYDKFMLKRELRSQVNQVNFQWRNESHTKFYQMHKRRTWEQGLTFAICYTVRSISILSIRFVAENMTMNSHLALGQLFYRNSGYYFSAGIDRTR